MRIAAWAAAAGLLVIPGTWAAAAATGSAPTAGAGKAAATTAPAAADKVAAGEVAPAGKVKIRPIYQEGRMLEYQLKMSGTTAWAPGTEGVQWGKMTTDFRFVLSPKVKREGGAYTFNLLGEHIRCVGEGATGTYGVDATRQKSQIKVKDLWQSSSADTPLVKPMTITLDPLGACQFATGTDPIAGYMLPWVDHAFWNMLTTAPIQEVAPGDIWKADMALPLGGKGKPVGLKLRWQVLGWQTHRGQKVLTLTLEGDLEIKATDVTEENGDQIHVTGGTVKAKGMAQWDVANGILSFAAADQKILLKVDKPQPRGLRSEAECSMELLGTKKVAPGGSVP